MTITTRRRATRGTCIVAGITALMIVVPCLWPRTTAAEERVPTRGGLNPSAQRAEMVRLLQSIDGRLKELLERERADGN